MVEKNKGAKLQFVSLESMTNVGRYKCPNCGKTYLLSMDDVQKNEGRYYCTACYDFDEVSVKDKK